MTTDLTLGLHSLATMARVLERPQPMNDVLALAAEGARLTLSAASASISRYEPVRGVVRTLINVGDLAPDEERWPEDETYPVTRWPELEEVIERGATRTDAVGDPLADVRELELLGKLNKGSSLTAAVIVDGQVWGEFYATRHPGHAPFGERSVSYVEILSALLGGAIARAQREPGE